MPEELYLVMIVHQMDDLPAYRGTEEECREFVARCLKDKAFLADADGDAIDHINHDVGTPPIGLQLFKVWPTLENVDYVPLEHYMS